MSSSKAAARDRVKQMREEQARKERRREQMMRFGIVGAVLVAIVIIGFAVMQNRAAGDSDEVGPEVLPSGVEESGGGVTEGEASAPVTIDVVLDFQCPHCATFEQMNGGLLDQMVDSGEVQVVNHPVSFLGVESRRAANAYGCSVDQGSGTEFLRAAFSNQTQFTNDSLLSIGEQVGLSGEEFETCVNDGTYNGWAAQVDANQREAGVQGTPTVFVNGQQLDSWTPDDIIAAVETASGGTEGSGGEEGADEDAAEE